MKCYHEKIIDEILEILKNNLILIYNFHDHTLPNIREYCLDHVHTRYKHLDYGTLIYFTEEALTELINTDYLYDFRDIE